MYVSKKQTPLLCPADPDPLHLLHPFHHLPRHRATFPCGVVVPHLRAAPLGHQPAGDFVCLTSVQTWATLWGRPTRVPVVEMLKLPVFATDKDAAEWFTAHDTAPYMDDLEDVTEEFRALRRRPVWKSARLRVSADYLEAIKTAAERRGIPYQTLVQTWLAEKLRQEAPDLLPVGRTA